LHKNFIGNDPDWKFKVDDKTREAENFTEAEKLVAEIREKKTTDQPEIKKERIDYSKDPKAKYDLLMNAKNTINNVRRLIGRGISDLDSNDKISIEDNQSSSEILFDLNDIVGSGYQGSKYKGGRKK
jgi:hypothetical protein